jgi:hypothetical protein
MEAVPRGILAWRRFFLSDAIQPTVILNHANCGWLVRLASVLIRFAYCRSLLSRY